MNGKKEKVPKTRGWYEFKDGTTAWFNGLSAHEKRVEESKHGKVVRFEHTDQIGGVMMEIKTCEEYDIRELENTQNELYEARKRIERLELEIEAKDSLISEFKNYFWFTVGGQND